MTITISAARAFDIRFPTSRTLDGSDAMNPDPDYSAAYCILETSQPGLSGHGLTFTLGRGTELCVHAIEALAPKLAGRSLDGIANDLGGFWRTMVADSQMRWLGPEKGIIHMAGGDLHVEERNGQTQFGLEHRRRDCWKRPGANRGSTRRSQNRHRSGRQFTLGENRRPINRTGTCESA